MTAEEFVTLFVAKLRARAVSLVVYGAVEPSKTCEQVAADLEADFRAWWLADLSVADAARESGYCEERLRQMAREGELPYKKSPGEKGHLTIARRDLPRRPKPKLSTTPSLEERLLRPREQVLRERA